MAYPSVHLLELNDVTYDLIHMVESVTAASCFNRLKCRLLYRDSP